jgi:AcrR family transcriptional regulator
MQYLKDEIKNRILESALEEFRTMGFQDASMRKIARNAHVAIGNVYHYYTNKQELFNALIGGVYDKMMYSLREFYKIDARAAAEYLAADSPKESFYGISRLVDSLLHICGEDNIQLLILLEKSRGVRNAYENAKRDLIETLTDVLAAKLAPNLEAVGKGGDHRTMMRVLAASFVEGFCIILREHEDGETVKALADRMIRIFFKDILDRF